VIEARIDIQQRKSWKMFRAMPIFFLDDTLLIACFALEIVVVLKLCATVILSSNQLMRNANSTVGKM